MSLYLSKFYKEKGDLWHGALDGLLVYITHNILRDAPDADRRKLAEGIHLQVRGSPCHSHRAAHPSGI